MADPEAPFVLVKNQRALTRMKAFAFASVIAATVTVLSNLVYYYLEKILVDNTLVNAVLTWLATFVTSMAVFLFFYVTLDYGTSMLANPAQLGVPMRVPAIF